MFHAGASQALVCALSKKKGTTREKLKGSPTRASAIIIFSSAARCFPQTFRKKIKIKIREVTSKHMHSARRETEVGVYTSRTTLTSSAVFFFSRGATAVNKRRRGSRQTRKRNKHALHTAWIYIYRRAHANVLTRRCCIATQKYLTVWQACACVAPNSKRLVKQQ